MKNNPSYEKYGNTGFYEIRTAYRADCPGAYLCGEIPHDTLIDKWICEGFILIYS